MEDIMNTLSRWYNIDIFYQNPSLKDITFTGDLKRYKDFNEIIKIIEITNLVKFEVKEKTIIIRKK
jgi:hypothetical protein